ncbi:MAG: hypothetical protein C0598_09730 [Marinilabiliales bacterium]|nr:MAG: hypothetical protein C0598_09730 [Marinilabiliales bacterium]
MVNKILGTAGTRVLNAIINLAVILLVTNFIGSEGYGIIGLVIVSVSIIQIFVDLLGGGTLIYFTSRKNHISLLLLSYAWLIIVISVFAMGFSGFEYFFPERYLEFIPAGQKLNVLLLALIGGFMLTHYNILIGLGKIKQYNIAFSIQLLSFISSFTYLLFMLERQDFGAYITALTISYIVGLLCSLVVFKYMKKGSDLNTNKLIKEMLNFGFVSQLANGFHILNKRISFYFINFFTGLSSLGVYNAGVQLSEGLRLIGQSISLVQFSEISKSRDEQYAISLTIKLMKLSVMLTFMGLLILLIMPIEVYEYLFTKEFTGIKLIIIALSPGVLALAANTIFSHYFSGLGNPKISLWGNIIGFIFTIVFAIVLIPVFGYAGAALTSSISYSSTVVYQYFVFKKNTGVIFRDWLPDKQDFTDFKKILSKLLNQSS